MKYIILFLLGFLAHKSTLEYSNWRTITAYNDCRLDHAKQYKDCRYTLTPSKVESFLLWQPNFWCSRTPFGCDVTEDRD